MIKIGKYEFETDFDNNNSFIITCPKCGSQRNIYNKPNNKKFNVKVNGISIINLDEENLIMFDCECGNQIKNYG